MRKTFSTVVMTLVVAVLVGVLSAPASQAQTGRQVYAYYFGWWTNESWNDRALTDRPEQLYDSRDGGVLGRHIDQAKSVGIDAFIMSWFGPKNNNLTHQVFNALLDQASARGFSIGASVDMFQADYNETVEAVTESLRYLKDRANHPAYVRYDGKPVVYFWNQDRFSRDQWQGIRDAVDPNREMIWVLEGTDTGLLGVFDGLYLFNVAWSSSFTQTANTFAQRTSAAGGSFFSATVNPGWDETAIAAREGRENPTDTQERGGSEFLTNSWSGAAASTANVITIVSWNEYFEGSHIEPSQNFGSAALDTLRPLIAAWKSGQPAPAAAPAPAGEAAPTGTVVEATATVNVRSAASTSGDILGKITPGTTYAVVETVDGWYGIQYNGGTGYVSASYVTVSEGQATSGGVSASSPGTPTGQTFTLSYAAKLRAEPSTDAAELATIPFSTVVQIVGFNANNTWVQINYNGQSGWVAARLGQVE